MKAITFSSLIIFNFSAFAGHDCNIEIEELDVQGNITSSNISYSYSSNSSLKHCFKEAGSMIGGSMLQNLQINLKHSSLNKKITIKLQNN